LCLFVWGFMSYLPCLFVWGFMSYLPCLCLFVWGFMSYLPCLFAIMFQDTEVSEDNFERGPPRDHPNQVLFNMVQWFWWRRFNVVSVQWMRDGWQMTDSKWWQKFTWPLSFESDKLIKSCFPSKVQWIWWTNDR
jgi:hypothetical protein